MQGFKILTNNLNLKIKKRLFSLFGLLTLSAVIITACQKDQATIDKQDNIVVMSTPVSGSGVTPQIIDGENGGGNRTCGEVAEAFKTSFDLSVGQYNYEDGVFDNEWPEGLTVTTDGTYVSFTVDGTIRIEGMCYIVGAVIVKGGNDANVYYYADGTLSDTGLSAPVNASEAPQASATFRSASTQWIAPRKKNAGQKRPHGLEMWLAADLPGGIISTPKRKVLTRFMPDSN
jgi:hypothetical protein